MNSNNLEIQKKILKNFKENRFKEVIIEGEKILKRETK